MWFWKCTCLSSQPSVDIRVDDIEVLNFEDKVKLRLGVDLFFNGTSLNRKADSIHITGTFDTQSFLLDKVDDSSRQIYKSFLLEIEPGLYTIHYYRDQKLIGESEQLTVSIECDEVKFSAPTMLHEARVITSPRESE